MQADSILPVCRPPRQTKRSAGFTWPPRRIVLYLRLNCSFEQQQTSRRMFRLCLAYFLPMRIVGQFALRSIYVLVDRPDAGSILMRNSDLCGEKCEHRHLTLVVSSDSAGSHTAHCPGAPRLHSGRGTRFQWVVKIRTQSMNQWVQAAGALPLAWPGLTPKRHALLPPTLPIYIYVSPYTQTQTQTYTTLLSFSCSC